MKSPLQQKGPNRNRTATLVLVAVGCVSLTAALAIGIADSPPGLALVYLAIVAWILALAHPWRQVRSFLILLAASLIGFPVSILLHNLFYGLGEMASDITVLSQALGALDVVFFILAVLVCPPGVLIGAVGSVVVAVLHFRRKRISGGMP
jgi:hypothetical protein